MSIYNLPSIRVAKSIATKVSIRCVRLEVLACLMAAGVGIGGPALAAECNGKTDALGVNRVIAVDPTEHPRIGTMQYPETLPLADHEVVLTFDDGPSPRYTDRILAALAAECVKATFFMVGEMAKTFPAEARKVEELGHTVGTHSFRHPFTFGRMMENQADDEIDKGIEAVGTALGTSAELAPFFRVPGFLTSKSTEAALASRGLMTWSADVPADDWKRINSAEVVKRAISRLEEKSRGILLLHDIHERTVAALPDILKELKQKGFKVVQVVPASTGTAKTQTTPDQWHLPPTATVIAELAKSPAADALPKSGAMLKMSALRRSRKGARKFANANGYRGRRGRIGGRRHANLICRSHNRGKDQARRCASASQDSIDLTEWRAASSSVIGSF
jgi:peptidoglycan/xylan/chitin deacetylase (PgdA/CDA1 family)